ncbi:MAG: DNA mismatch repair protein MutS [Phycisphaerales bacterium]|nr:DNA mismatch repair protein MutS [Phycisphaerales bacterium]
MAKDPWDTPAMRQWTAIKEQHPECVLFFRMGDFYELFGDDATNLARDLGLALAKRGSAIPFAGVPHHQKSNYLQKAIDAGYRVAVVDQLEDPKEAKGVVKRGVTQVVTPGTLVDEALMLDEQTAYLGAIAFDDDHHAGIAIVELSTGAFIVYDGTTQSCIDQLARIGVRELLFAQSSMGQTPSRTQAVLDALQTQGTGQPSWMFRKEEALQAIHEQYGSATTAGFGLDENLIAIRAAGVVLRYLRQTQAVDQEETNATSGSEFQRQRSTLAHLRAPSLIDRSSTCTIDATSLRALEITQTIRDQSIEGSLAGVFLASQTGTRCVLRTPMGKRMIRHWLSAPLTEPKAINTRLDAVQALKDDRTLAGALGDQLAPITDIARIAGRVALGRATPRDLVALGTGASAIRALIDTLDQSSPLEHHRAALISIESALSPVAEAIVSRCIDDPPSHLREGGLFRDGIDPQLDEARSLERDAGTWLVNYQTKLMEEHDLPSMKVGYNKVFGYYIELPTGQAARAPDIFTRKQTLKNAERYITPDLKEFEDKVLGASGRAIERERLLFDQLCEQARTILDELGAYAHTVGELDVLTGFADKAHHRGWTRPTIDTSLSLDITKGRHPVLDEMLEQRFIPNDTKLATPDSSPHLSILTGPNMAGKSTYIRQCALLVVLAQSGSFVPADSMSLGITDRIFTRVGADDALHQGLSTFMVEMTETANILNNTTDRSLVILDEIGRGTSTLDGLSLAWAIAEHLALTNPSGPRTLFATHYHEITQLEQQLEGKVKNLHVAVKEWTTEDGVQEIAFLHSIRPGRADQSYGVHVARLAGVPTSVTHRATEVLESLSVEQADRIDTTAIQATGKSASKNADATGQLGLFTEFLNHPVVDELREVKLDNMTPMQAFDALRKLQSKAGSRESE